MKSVYCVEMENIIICQRIRSNVLYRGSRTVTDVLRPPLHPCMPIFGRAIGDRSGTDHLSRYSVRRTFLLTVTTLLTTPLPAEIATGQAHTTELGQTMHNINISKIHFISFY